MDISSSQLMQQTMSVMQAQTNGDILQRGVEGMKEANEARSGASQSKAFDGRGIHVNIKA